VNVNGVCRFSERLEMTYRLDAERYSTSSLSRVMFVRRSRRRTVEASVVEDSLMMNQQTDPNSVCHLYVAHITVRTSVYSHFAVFSFLRYSSIAVVILLFHLSCRLGL